MLDITSIPCSELLVVGVKETQKALCEERVAKLYLAQDADDFVLRDLLETLNEQKVECVQVESMEKLGKACGIEVGAAAAAILKR